jgi:hypothetical protein
LLYIEEVNSTKSVILELELLYVVVIELIGALVVTPPCKALADRLAPAGVNVKYILAVFVPTTLYA